MPAVWHRERIIIDLTGRTEVAALVPSDKTDVEALRPFVVGELPIRRIANIDAERNVRRVVELGDHRASPLGIQRVAGTDRSPFIVAGRTLSPRPTLREEQRRIVLTHRAFLVRVCAVALTYRARHNLVD